MTWSFDSKLESEVKNFFFFDKKEEKMKDYLVIKIKNYFK